MKIRKTVAYGFGLLWLFSFGGYASAFKHIQIDGALADWAGVEPVYQDPPFEEDPIFPDDPARFEGAVDLKSVYIAHDDDYLYLRFTLYVPRVPFSSHENVFIDADNDLATGFPAVGARLGSEMLIQGGTGYQEKNGTFNDGSLIADLDWLAAPLTAATDFEFRISRKAKYESDGLPVFAGDTISILLETENAQFSTVETAPDAEGLSYTFTPAPSPATTNVTLVDLAGTPWRYNDSGNDLGSAWREVGYDDAQAGWAVGSGLFGVTADPSPYPVSIQTAIDPGPRTDYFRVHFEWTNNPSSVALVVSNYLSDGAVLYLNGVEAKRVRLPSGEIAFNTPATTGPQNKGKVELLGLLSESLVIGDNVLAVEVHQTAGDTADLVFGMALLAAAQFEPTITAPSQPEDRSVGAGDSTTFSTEFTGTFPLSFQWLKDNVPIPQATNATFTINPVLQNDSGSYALQLSNPIATNLTRAAVLTVTNSPVRITDDSEPVDQTVTEGLSASFEVVAVGSLPLSYQWFKGDAAIPDATNSVYAIPNVLLADAGDFRVVVTNPFPSLITSRTARLTVNRDTNSPTLTSIVGTPDRITLTFSEPVDAASASTPANYSLSSGLGITRVEQDTNDLSVVVLNSSAQALGTNYTVTVNSVSDRFNNTIAPNTTANFRSRIGIDGSYTDWATVPLAFSDPQDSTESTDYKDVSITSDEDYLYMRVTLHVASDLAIFYNNIFIDADNDPATGYGFGGLGSEMLVQGGGGYQQKNGGFNEGDITGLDWAIFPAGIGTEFEFRISRHATYASDGLPVFGSATIVLALEAENTGFAIRESAPDSGGQPYAFGSPQTDPVNLLVRFDQGQVVITWTGPGKLQSKVSLTEGAWQEVAGATSPYRVQPNDSERYFRLAE